MSPNSQLKHIRRLQKSIPFPTIAKTLHYLHTKQTVINRRRRNATILKLDSALFESQAYTCNQILASF